MSAPSPSSPIAVALVGMAALAAAIGIGRFSLTPLVPLLQADSTLTLAQAAALASGNYFGYLLGALSCTAAPPRPATAVVAGLALVGAATAAMAAGTDLTLWLPLWSACGAASAYVLVGVSAWSLPVLAAHGRQHWSGWVFAGVGAGIALVGMLAFVAALADIAPAALWLALGIVTAGTTLAAWHSVEQAPKEVRRVRVRAGSLSRRERVLILCYGLFGMGYIVPATFLPAMARARAPDAILFGAGWPLFGIAPSYRPYSPVAC